MEKDDIMGALWIFLLYGYMFAVKALVPEPYATYLGAGGLIFLFLGIWFQELYATKKYSVYRLVVGILYPYNKIVKLFYKHATIYDLGNGRRMAELELGKPTKVPEYGKVDKVYIHYEGSWARRFRFKTTKVRVMGVTIDHPSGDHAVLFELPYPKVEHGQPYPHYYLVTAGGDLPSKPSLVIRRRAPSAQAMAKQAMTNGGGVNINEVCHEWIEKWRLAEAKARSYHQKLIRLEEMVSGLVDETKALLKSKKDIADHARQLVLSWAEHYGSIIAAAKAISKRVTISWTKHVAPAIIVCAIIAYLWGNPHIVATLLAWLYTPQGAFAVIIALAIIGYIIYRRVKKVV